MGGDSTFVSNCSITSEASTGNGNDCIAVHDVPKVVIDCIRLFGKGGSIDSGIKNDAIDLDDIDSCFLSNSYITNFSDDGIDIGTNTAYAIISKNLITNCNFGITAGESSIVYLYNNIVCNNEGGFQTHHDAIVYSYNNTLYSNTYGIECFHSSDGDEPTGGKAYVYSTIISNSQNEDIHLQPSSFIQFTNCLSDKEELPGENNIYGDPLFTNAADGKFTLKTGSPCIGNGFPDGEGNNTTIGAVDEIVDPTGLAIHEKATVHCFPNPFLFNFTISLDNDDFITIYNNQGQPVYSQFLQKGINTINLHNEASGLYFIKFANCQKALTIVKN
ncbi:MAG: T9SS type A sorting domain-containing protein [Bacteroidales bacterium]|nr:T9SS type A sorting domain-containing protein [Bacteroidales bacterium]